jgi:hypothetical protein
VFLILGVGAAFMTLFKMTSRMSNRKWSIEFNKKYWIQNI